MQGPLFRGVQPFHLPKILIFIFSQKYDITQYGELGFSYLTQMKDDYATNYRYLTYHLFSKGWRNLVRFESGSERVNWSISHPSFPKHPIRKTLLSPSLNDQTTPCVPCDASENNAFKLNKYSLRFERFRHKDRNPF